MIAVNLIPQSRLEAQRRGIRRRRWATIAGGYGLFLAVAMVSSGVAGSRDDHALREGVDESAARVERARVDLARLESELAEATALLTANRSVGNQPDWSVLLGLISEASENDIVLRECTVRSSEPDRREIGRPQDGSAEHRTTVELHGLARTQLDVSNFVLRTESIPVFRDVTRHDTRREPFLGGHVVAFRLDFSLDGSEDGP